MENKVGALELQNQDLKGEVSQLKEQMTQMFQVLSQTNTTIAAMAHQHAARQEQEQAKAEAQHQASWTILPFVIHQGSSYGLEVVNLCLVPDVGLPAEFKTPEFDKYKGNSYPRVHLAMYCRKMEAYIHDDKILIHFFQDSLTGVALGWYVSLERGLVKTWRDLAEAFLKQYKYNEDMAPDRSRLQSLAKKKQEGFKEYA
ncbi:hypothetical protein CR513_57172, partial [Mucuna pruriens]